MSNKLFQKWIYSKSKIAMILRLLAWGILVVAIVAGVIESFADAEPVPLLLNVVCAAGAMLFLYTVAAILNYLAEITELLKRNHGGD